MNTRAERPDGGHLGRADPERERADGAVAGGVAVGADDDLPGAIVAVLGRIWWQMPPSSPRMSWNFVMPCGATNSRIFFWFVAVFALSAGTR